MMQRLLCSVGMAVSAIVGSAAVAVGGADGEVLGVVTGGGGPVSGARVTVFQPSLAYFAETRTAADGSYAFSGVPLGPKQLGVAAVGFEYDELLIDVSCCVPWMQSFDLSSESAIGSWDVIGNTLPELFDATDIGVLLPDGTLFYCHDTVDPIRFDPITGEKTFPAGSGVEQGCMNGTLRGDGEIVMVGGQTPSDPGAFTNAVRWVKRYDISGNFWAFLPQLVHQPGRWYPGLARLADGAMLVMGGGQAPDASRTDTCERFDQRTGVWSYTGSMLEPTEFPPAALLHTGCVLATWWPPQLYDPDTGQWSVTGAFNQPARGWPGHSDHSLIVLSDGRALAIGARVGPGSVMGELYDPQTETWSLTSSPDLVRFQSEVVALPDGRILVAGGETQANPPPVPDVLGIVKWTDLYDPATDAWRRVADLNWFREYHAVTLLVPDGRVLTTGGTHIKFQFGPTSADIEAYSPPYLLRGVRPQITSISNTAPSRASTITLEIAPQTQLTSVVLMGMQSTTHWVDAGIPRRLVLAVSQKGSTATATLPCDENVLPVGHYMLFAMVDDIPSVARVVNVKPRVGDVNGDGDVGFADILAVIGDWGRCPPPPASCSADLTGDGGVGFADVLAVIAQWGDCS